MKAYHYKTTVTLNVESIVVAEDEEKAKEILEKAIEGVLKDEVKSIYIASSESEINSPKIESMPSHFTSNHHRLIECGYPAKMIESYSEEDAEAELEAITSLL